MTVLAAILLPILIGNMVVISACLFMSRNETRKEIKAIRLRKDENIKRSE